MSSPSRSQNPVALITGSAKRIGARLALGLAQRGYDIALHYHRSQSHAEDWKRKICSETGQKCILFQADLTNDSRVSELIPSVFKQFQRLDLLVNSASQYYPKDYLAFSHSDWVACFDLHIKTPFFLSQAFIQLCRQTQSNGHIINITDATSLDIQHEFTMYNISKSALNQLTRSLAKLAAPRIRVNAIAPGWILAPIHGVEEDEQEVIQDIPLRHKGNPDHILRALYYLLDNDYVTGEVLMVDGGRHL
ncbi:MAG: SDR family oxidoreductase [Myxococcota bacterium]|nr:SDR family oxidoreductase [Myxococcota bacterium]